MFLLDTNVISELRKAHHKRTDPVFRAWAKDLQWEELYLSVITLYELEVGISRLAEYDSAQSAILRVWLDKSVVGKFEHRILPVTQEIALLAGKLQRSRSRSPEDTLIAATALINGMRLVTRNIADFQDANVHIINPWQL